MSVILAPIDTAALGDATLQFFPIASSHARSSVARAGRPLALHGDRNGHAATVSV